MVRIIGAIAAFVDMSNNAPDEIIRCQEMGYGFTRLNPRSLPHTRMEQQGETMTMTRRERLRRCYFNQEVDRPAVYTRTGFPPGDETYDRLKAYLQAYTELKGNWNGISLGETPWIYRFASPAGIKRKDLETDYRITFQSASYSEDFER